MGKVSSQWGWVLYYNCTSAQCQQDARPSEALQCILFGTLLHCADMFLLYQRLPKVCLVQSYCILWVKGRPWPLQETAYDAADRQPAPIRNAPHTGCTKTCTP